MLYQKSYQKKKYAISWMTLSNPLFPGSIELKSVYAALCVTNFSDPQTLSWQLKRWYALSTLSLFHFRYSGELHFLVSLVMDPLGYLHWVDSSSFSSVSRKFHSNSFFSITLILWNRLPKARFPDHNNLKF